MLKQVCCYIFDKLIAHIGHKNKQRFMEEVPGIYCAPPFSSSSVAMGGNLEMFASDFN